MNITDLLNAKYPIKVSVKQPFMLYWVGKNDKSVQNISNNNVGVQKAAYDYVKDLKQFNITKYVYTKSDNSLDRIILLTDIFVPTSGKINLPTPENPTGVMYDYYGIVIMQWKNAPPTSVGMSKGDAFANNISNAAIKLDSIFDFTQTTTTPVANTKEEHGAVMPSIYIYSGIGAAAGLGAYHFGYPYINKIVKIGTKGTVGYVIAAGVGLAIGYLIYKSKSKKRLGASNHINNEPVVYNTQISSLREQFVKAFNDFNAYQTSNPIAGSKQVNPKKALDIFDSLKTDAERNFYIDYTKLMLELYKSVTGKDANTQYTIATTYNTKIFDAGKKYGLTESRISEIISMA